MEMFRKAKQKKDNSKDNKQSEVKSGRDRPWTPYTICSSQSPVCINVSVYLCIFAVYLSVFALAVCAVYQWH